LVPGHAPDVVEYEVRDTLQLAEAVFDAVRKNWKNNFNLRHGDSDPQKYAPLCSHVLKVSNLRENHK
jgi:hypothetical protein